MAQCIVRSALLADAEAIFAIHMAAIRQLAPSHYEPSEIEAWCGNRSPSAYIEPISSKTVLVAESTTAVVGFGQLDSRAGVVEAVYVLPSASRSGVGSALLAELERRARVLSIERLTLDASLNAQAFYASRGYLAEGQAGHELQPGVFLRCVHMAKKLSHQRDA